MLLLPEDASKDYLDQELQVAEKALQQKLRLQEQQLQERQIDTDGYDYSTNSDSSQQLPKRVQLAQLSEQVDSLALAQSMAEWIAQAPQEDVDDKVGDAPSSSSSSLLMAQSEWCHRLAQLLVDHSSRILTQSLAKVYDQTFLPLYEYLVPSMVQVLRQELHANQYPKTKGSCAQLIHSCQTAPDTSAFGQACYWIFVLQESHHSLLEALDLTAPGGGGGGDLSSSATAATMIVRELLRPLIRRICFHFVEASPDRMTTTRIDKLPEWLLNYVRETILEGPTDGDDNDCPHGVIHVGLTCVLPSQQAIRLGICFWQELIRLIQWVLVTRDFFRHPDIAGPRSNPVYLYNAMERFLLFDRTLREQAPVGGSSDDDEDAVLFGLMDTLVMADDELRKWWIDREREAVFSVLFEDNSMVNVPKPLANHVSPRAEVFCSLIRSVQWKASLLTAPGIYLRQVAVPLCSQFVDALSETSSDLRNLLCQPCTPGSTTAMVKLKGNIQEWIEIINGTHLAARVLLKPGSWQDGMPKASVSDHDLARFGRSLERLVDVLVEEFAASFVETILMERAKLASYVMMASHLLASPEWEGDDSDLSAELKEARGVLFVLHQVCHSILEVGGNDIDKTKNPKVVDTPSSSSGGSPSDQEIARFAPRAIQTQVVNRLADKFLEVALDIHDLTPNLYLEGSKVFARDVDVMVGNFYHLPLVQRLLDVTTLLTMDSNNTQGLFAALGGLVGATDFLDIHHFSSDETIYDEAVMMLQAKGLKHIEIKDAVSILNRKRY